ncbi:hypothetical protein [Gemmata obscuriglobus]|nr:hypothetical protein [Gemmata obscuriglobus]
MALSGCDEIDETYTCGPFSITFKGRNDDIGADPSLPRKVRRTSDKVQDVYRAFVAIWNDPNRRPDPIMPKPIRTWLLAEYARAEPDKTQRKDAPRSSIQHALSDLQELGIIHQHGDGGWVMGPRPEPKQGTITDDEGVPNENGTHSPLEQAATITHASHVGGADVVPPRTGAQDMFGKLIWVPGEKDDFETGGLVITDDTGTSHLAEGKQERVRYSGRTGRPAAPLAVRCELVTVDDSGRHKVAVVKIKGPEGTKQIRVRVLGDWQLAGRMSDREEPATLAASN